MEKLKTYFLTCGFNEADTSRILESFLFKELAKGDFLVQEGKTNKYLAFVNKGFLQFFILLDGEEKTTYSAGENSFATSLASFLKQEPAKENIRAVVNTEVWVIEKKQLKKIIETIPAFKDFYIELLEWQICCIDESRLDAILLNARQRYEKMLQKEPDLIQQIPLQFLASILGVTPRHLSRIRNNIR